MVTEVYKYEHIGPKCRGNGMNNRRTTKTKRAIHGAFLGLLEHKPLNRITVAELSRAADLGRGTFYLHYQDIYDLSAQLENELLRDLGELYEAAFPCTERENLVRLTDTVTAYMEENRELFLGLMRRGPEGATLQSVKKFFVGKMLQEPVDLPNEDWQAEVVFLVAGVVGVLEDWISEGMKKPRERVAGSLYRMLEKVEIAQG